MNVKRSALIVVALALLTQAAFAAPKIGVDADSWDAVIPSAGALVRHVFTVINGGDTILRISGVEFSCTCTTATPTTGEVLPGKSLPISVVEDTTGFVGRVYRTVTIVSNDPDTPELLLTISITVADGKEAALPTISAEEFHKRFYFLVDVRTPEEFAAGHLLGAVNIPLAELQDNLRKWTAVLPKNTPLVLQCRSGARSAQATRILIKAGFTNVLNLDGGILGWENAYGTGYRAGF
jgi:rhodanese-related sulfurtransferase